VEVWDSDTISDDLIGKGFINIKNAIGNGNTSIDNIHTVELTKTN